MKIGIDFGTTFSLPAALINGSPTTLLPHGEYGMPSVFYRDSKSGILIGKSADNRGNFRPENTVRDVKMSISDTTTNYFRLDGEEFDKKQIVGRIIKEVVSLATEEIERKQLASSKIKGAVISVPAAFNIRELDFIRQAAEDNANLRVLGFIREPVAAAIAYFNAPRAEDKKTILIYDLGGGTCDVAIVRADKNAKEWYTVLASGMERIGGRDWDKILVELIKTKCREQEYDIRFGKRDEEKIRGVAVEIKHKLSRLQSVNSEVEVGGEVYDIEITRREFERKTFELLKKTMDLTDDLKKKFGGKIDYIVCVGGSSNMPQIKDAFNKRYPDIASPPTLYAPEEAIAFGAAIYADHLQQDNYLRDICKFSYGARYIENFEKYRDRSRRRIYNIIYKDEKLPALGQSTSYKLEDGQQSIHIPIYESVCKDDIYLPENGEYIGEISIEGSPNSRKNDETLLTMTIDKSGLMHLEAIDKRTGRSEKADIHLNGY